MILGCFLPHDLPSNGLYGVNWKAEVGFPLLSFPQISKAEKGCEGRDSATGFRFHLHERGV